MAYRTGRRAERQVGLVEDVLAQLLVVVCGERDQPGERVDRAAGIDVLVELVVVGVHRAVADAHVVVECMVDRDRALVHRRGGRALVRVAEERRCIGAERPVHRGLRRERRDAAIGDAVVIVVLVGDPQHRRLAEREGERGVHALALQLEPVAVALGVLVHARDARGESFADRIADVEGRALAVPGAALQRQLAHRLPVRLARHAVHDPARAAATEDHRVRALQDLDPVEVVQVTVILDVVAHAVEEEIAGRAVAAQDDRVAVALALRHARAGHVARHVGQALHRLVLDQVARDDGDRLRNVDECRVGLRGGAASLGEVAVGLVLAEHGHLR